MIFGHRKYLEDKSDLRKFSEEASIQEITTFFENHKSEIDHKYALFLFKINKISDGIRLSCESLIEEDQPMHLELLNYHM